LISIIIAGKTGRRFLLLFKFPSSRLTGLASPKRLREGKQYLKRI
jgi:hypothetical protein